MIYVGLTEKVALEQDTKEGIDVAIISGNSGRRNSYSKLPKEKAFLLCSRSITEDSVAGAEWARVEEWKMSLGG